MRQALEVWLDCDLASRQQGGRLSHDRGTVWFEYAPAWIDSPLAFQLDPDLRLGAGPIYPNAETSSFGVFLDSAPDRWGQTLMKRRETLQAKDEGRTARKLYAWDFLQGVQDITHQGALRYRREGDERFVAHDALAAPPVTSLGELADVTRELTRRDRGDLDQLRRWLAVLVAPGASLGGARPKANFVEADGDHLRNHGFMLAKQGWRLAPAFDVNPNNDKEAHVLTLDEIDNRPSLLTLLTTADYYRLKPSDAKAILQEVRGVVIIAHRLSTIRNAHRVFVLDQGRLVEQRTYAELRESEGSWFGVMVDLQAL